MLLVREKKIVIFQTIFKEVFCVLTLCNYTRVNNTFFVCGFFTFFGLLLTESLDLVFFCQAGSCYFLLKFSFAKYLSYHGQSPTKIHFFFF